MASSQARAADSVYWANFGVGKISYANLAGGGGGDIDTAGQDATLANGMAIDAAAGKIYWITAEPAKVHYANLSGGGGGELSTVGATPGFAVGLAIDPAAGRVYWGNSVASKISYANLNGSGGGDLDTTGATVESPVAVAVSPATGKIYWANSEGPIEISYASLSGGGGGDINPAGTTGEETSGIAIDAAAGKVYWSDYAAGKISYANLNGSGAGDLNTTGATVVGPFGVAVDPVAGRVYWANEGAGKISYANVNGSGGADLDTTGATMELPAFPVLLKAPSPGAVPLASGGPKPGSTLSCAAGGWAPDLLESFLYRAPQSTAIQWLDNGQAIPGATTSSLTAAAVGTYSCQSIATNHAGSTSQTSAPLAIFSIGKAKANPKKGTATLAVQVPGAGTLSLAGRNLVRQVRSSAATSISTVTLLVKAKGKARKALAKKGKVRLGATVTFAPLAGAAATQATTLTLKKKKPAKKNKR